MAEGAILEWDAAGILQNRIEEKHAVIILNQPILEPYKELISNVWKNATLRLCADGGANVLYDAFGEGCTLPHEIRGDLDSIRPEVQSFFEGRGVTVIRARSEYATDLQKCLRAVEIHEEQNSPSSTALDRMAVVIVGGLSGRLDQTMHTLHVLCQLTSPQALLSDTKGLASGDRIKNDGMQANDSIALDKRSKSIVMSENSIAWLLAEGKHRILIDQTIFGPTCGLLPFRSKLNSEEKGGVRIWTTGLRWNLQGEECAVGGFLSTSNHLKDDTVEVETDGTVIWTMEIRTTTDNVTLT